MIWPKQITNLIEVFSKFPQIGPKTAQRFVFWLLKKEKKDLEKFSQMIKDLTTIEVCQLCGNYTQGKICPICQDKTRDKSILCLVSTPSELQTIEQTKKYSGLYFILGGLIDSLEDDKIKEIRIDDLLKRLKQDKIKEIIFAFSPTIEGETTLLYLEDIIKKKFPKIRLSKLARGISLGTHLEYADEVTLGEAIKKREKIK